MYRYYYRKVVTNNGVEHFSPRQEETDCWHEGTNDAHIIQSVYFVWMCSSSVCVCVCVWCMKYMDIGVTQRVHAEIFFNFTYCCHFPLAWFLMPTLSLSQWQWNIVDVESGIGSYRRIWQNLLNIYYINYDELMEWLDTTTKHFNNARDSWIKRYTYWKQH